nr:ribonuclease H-like domain-containing protein [Tanacetum cinerariifolium]
MSRFPFLDDLTVKAKSMCYQLLVKMDEEAQRDSHVLKDLLDTLNVMQVGCKETKDLMQELEQKRLKLGPYKSLEFFKELRMSDTIRMMELRQVIVDLQISINKKWQFIQETGLNDFRRFTRVSKLAAKFNGYVIDSNLRHGFEKHVSYAKLNSLNYYFATTLHKSFEPATYHE